MTEKYPSHDLENELERLELRVSKRIGMQMTDIVRLPDQDLTPDTRGFTPENSFKLAEFARENGDHLGDFLVNARRHLPENQQYQPEELDDASLALLKLCLLTPHHVDNQMKRDLEQDNTQGLKREMVEYGEAMRNAVRADPDIRQSSLIKYLRNVVQQARMPYPHIQSSRRIFEQITNGMIGELAAEDLVRSPAAQEAGIVYHETSTDDDLRGVDIRVTIPIQRGRRRIDVPVNLDPKYNRSYFLSRLPASRQDQIYIARGQRATIWPLVDWEEMDDRMTLTEEQVIEKGVQMVPVLQEIAEDIYDWNTRAGMGRTATRNYHG
jgi:hypothetical protein